MKSALRKGGSVISTVDQPSTTTKLPVSVIVPVLNEERNLAAALDSVSWAEEICVVDSGSRDHTCQIAEQYGARVVQFHYQPGGPRKKNWTLDNVPLRNDWVLILDADERITPALYHEIAEVLSKDAPCQGYYLNRKLIFLGRWIRHGGNYPSWNLRLFRRDAGRYERLATEDLASAGDVEVHEHVVLQGTAGYLREPMLHLDFKDLASFFDRHNRYSTWDARVREQLLQGKEFSAAIPGRLFGSPIERKRFLKRVWVHLPCRPLMLFVLRYFFQLGFLDGRPGLIYCILKAVYEFEVNCKLYEARLAKRAPSEALPPDGFDGTSCEKGQRLLRGPGDA